jgi:GTP-binding protein YchF
MGLQVGIVGLPNVGKSTLFNALSAAGAQAANYPFATIDPNVGVAEVADARLDRLVELTGAASRVPATVEFVDVAGLVSGASTGEGLGNQFLGHIRDVDAIAHVVRCFGSDDVVHVPGDVDPVRDIETVASELVLADLDTVDKRLDRVRRTARTGDREAAAEADALESLRAHLDTGEPERSVEVDHETRGRWRHLGLVTAKPVVYVANVAEGELAGNAHSEAVRAHAEREGAEAVAVAAETEAQLAELDAADRGELLSDLGLADSGLDRLVVTAERLLGLIRFYSTRSGEVRAWHVPAGSTAPRAAGQIHTDMERGFIRAEVISFEDYEHYGSEQAVKDAGRLRVEGRDYVVAHGDVIRVRFNV